MIVAPRRIRRILPIVLRICVALAVTFAVIIGALVGYSAVHRAEAVTLPAPTGPFAVGRTIVEWTDTGRPDPLGQAPNVPRELQVWIWYPAEQTTSAPLAPYLPADLLQATAADLGIGRFLRQDPGTVQSHARANPPVAGGATRFPIVVFEPGYGFVPADYTTLLESLASQGYVVVGIVPTDLAPVVAFSDGRIVTRSTAGSLPDEAPPAVLDPMIARLVDVSAADVRFVLDRLQAADRAILRAVRVPAGPQSRRRRRTFPGWRDRARGLSDRSPL